MRAADSRRASFGRLGLGVGGMHHNHALGAGKPTKVRNLHAARVAPASGQGESDAEAADGEILCLRWQGQNRQGCRDKK